MEEGDFVAYRRRKAILLEIEDLSNWGSYPDLYRIQMCKTGEVIETNRQCLRLWKTAKKQDPKWQ